ncbi:MAG: hypothetical protein JWN38_849 [Candidatus Saccharibacteria bacterium]|nr:hypothetical protein [Candidatus Saccharibacteria bacterium]
MSISLSTANKAELAYDSESDVDQELYREARIRTLGDFATDWSVLAGTVAGSPDRLNEDAFAANLSSDRLQVAVFDGTTSLVQVPGLGKMSGARFASHYLKDLFSDLVGVTKPSTIVTDLNKALLEKSLTIKGVDAGDTNTLPASTGTVVSIDPSDNSLSFAHIGDSFAVVYRESGVSELLTNNTNLPFDARLYDLINEIAASERITHREAQADPRVKELAYNLFIEKNNHPNGHGSGVINGDPNMGIYIQSGQMSLDGVRAILLGTDGLVPQGWSVKNSEDRRAMLDAVESGGVKQVIATKRLSENQDPDWQHTRWKHSDDATCIVLTTD